MQNYETNYINDTGIFIPSMVFITTLSNFFKDRQNNFSTNVSVGLFNQAFLPPFYLLNNLAIDRVTTNSKKCYTIIFVDDLITQNVYKNISQNLRIHVITLNQLGSSLYRGEYDIEYTTIIFVNFEN